MKTGYTDLDKIISLNPGDLIVVGSRPSMGKSTLMRQIALNLAKQSKSVFFADLQCRIEETLLHMICLEADIEISKIGKMEINNDSTDLFYFIESQMSLNQESGEGTIDGYEYQRFICAKNYIENLNINFSKVLDPISDIFEYNLGKFPKVLFIDYIQIAACGKENIDSLLCKLKAKAIENNSVVVVASQINRRVDERPGKRPILSDLSITSYLEEISDKVLLIYRREYYDPLDKPGMAEIIISKNRMGAPGNCNLVFRKQIPGFFNYQPIR